MSEHIPAEKRDECEACHVAPQDINELTATIDDLQQLLRAARYYVYIYEPQRIEQEEERGNLLMRIDEAAPEPPPPKPPAPCGKEFAPGQVCISDQGHNGECDDIPF